MSRAIFPAPERPAVHCHEPLSSPLLSLPFLRSLPSGALSGLSGTANTGSSRPSGDSITIGASMLRSSRTFPGQSWARRRAAIARRALGLSERLARRETSPSEAGTQAVASRAAFPLPARTRGPHVGSDWRRYSRELGKARARARATTPVGEAGASSRPRGYGGREKPSRGALRATTAMQERSCRQPAKPFRWRAVVTARLP